MGVRLSKVLPELNIGLQMAVDFLKTKKSLGEIKDDATLSTKITDEQYEALVKEFKGDKDIKKQAEMIFPKKKEKEKDHSDINSGSLTPDIKKEKRRWSFAKQGKNVYFQLYLNLKL